MLINQMKELISNASNLEIIGTGSGNGDCETQFILFKHKVCTRKEFYISITTDEKNIYDVEIECNNGVLSGETLMRQDYNKSNELLDDFRKTVDELNDCTEFPSYFSLCLDIVREKFEYCYALSGIEKDFYFIHDCAR